MLRTERTSGRLNLMFMKQFFVFRVKLILISILFILLPGKNILAQNVGIGITFPERAKLETRGQVGNTLALFGQDATGVSLVTNNPGIYFNSYSNGGVRSIQAGLTGNITFDAGLGRFQFNRTNHATGPDQSLTETQLLSIESNGNLIANVFRYPFPRTFYYSIPSADFTSRSSAEPVAKEIGTGGAFMLDGSGANGLVASVHLPHGATVTAVTFYYTDIAPTTDVTMALLKYDPIALMYSTMAMVSSSGTPGPTSSTVNTIASPNIDNSDGSYLIRCTTLPATWPTTIHIRTVIITYAMIEGN